MNQPKFRGYSKETERWHYGHGWFKSNYTEEYKQESGEVDVAILYTNSSPVVCELDSMGQFTEVYDFNDNEIFSNDIVEGVLRQQDCRFLAKVIFEDGMFKLEFDKNYNGIIYEDLTRYNACELEVIGDFYSNPQLLLKD